MFDLLENELLSVFNFFYYIPPLGLETYQTLLKVSSGMTRRCIFIVPHEFFNGPVPDDIEIHSTDKTDISSSSKFRLDSEILFGANPFYDSYQNPEWDRKLILVEFCILNSKNVSAATWTNPKEIINEVWQNSSDL